MAKLTRAELEERVAELEETLEEVYDQIGELLGIEPPAEEEEEEEERTDSTPFSPSFE